MGTKRIFAEPSSLHSIKKRCKVEQFSENDHNLKKVHDGNDESDNVDDDDGNDDENLNDDVENDYSDENTDSTGEQELEDSDLNIITSIKSSNNNVRFIMDKEDLVALPLSERLRIQKESQNNALTYESKSSHRKLAKEKIENRHIGRLNKNAPAEMASNRPVRRLRNDLNTIKTEFRDPRFSEISGKLDERIFAKNYSFIDESKEKEIEKVSSVLKKVKNADQKAELKASLLLMKQQLAERRRGLAVMHKLDAVRQEEKKKVKLGQKKPYFLKDSVKKTIALDERYKELKKDGKLQKYVEKRRKKNAAKDRRYLPVREE